MTEPTVSEPSAGPASGNCGEPVDIHGNPIPGAGSCLSQGEGDARYILKSGGITNGAIRYGQGVQASDPNDLITLSDLSRVPSGPEGPRGPQGIQGPIGPPGSDGPRGPIGPGLTVSGSAPWADIILKPDPQLGDMWLLSTATGAPASPSGPAAVGDGIVWDGTQWLNIGSVKGPKGDKGDKGDPGPQGDPGPAGPGLTSSVHYLWGSTTTTADPGAGRISVSGTGNQPRVIAISETDADNVHRSIGLLNLADSIVISEDLDSPTQFSRYMLTSNPVDQGAYWTMNAIRTDTFGPTQPPSAGTPLRVQAYLTDVPPMTLDNLGDVSAPPLTPVGKVLGTTTTGQWGPVDPPSGIPTGMVMPFAGTATTLPGWLVCQGQAVSRSTYAALFAAIGITWGAGDGTTTFNVPNIVDGRTIVGPDPGDPAMNAPGKSGGAKTHTLTSAEMPAHQHSGFFVDATGFGYVRTNVEAGGGGRVPTTDLGATAYAGLKVGSTGGGGAHNNMPPYVTMHHFIKT